MKRKEFWLINCILFLFFTICFSTFGQANHLKIILMAGQSNMVGVGNNSELPSNLQNIQTDVPVYISLMCDASIANQWTYLQPGDGELLSSHGCELSFADGLKQTYPNDNFALIKCAMGGSVLAAEWLSPTAGGPAIYYTSFINCVNSALNSLPTGTTYELIGMLWMQGESDATNLSWANNYEFNLTSFITDVRSALGVPQMPFIIGKIDTQSAWTYNAIVRQAEDNVASNVNNCTIIDTQGYPTDGIHYTSAGYVQMGNAFKVALTSSLTDNLPIGFLDNVSQTSGSGWAYDQDAGTLPIDVHIYIDGRFYAAVTANQSRPDLVTAGITPNAEHGFSFTITGYDPTRAHEVIAYAINYGGGDNPVLTNCPATIGTQPSGNSTISNVAGPSNIVITTTQRLAGAIHSLTWNGKEFIDSFDHGRQLQSATSFNGYGECFNPTEAGCSQDGTGNTSTSFLQYLNASGNYLETQCLPAFWTQPGFTAPGCGSAVNTTQRASHYFHKKVTIGIPNMPHVIKYDVGFDIPSGEICTSGTFEALTGYMPSEFSVFWTYDPASQQLTALSDGPGEQGLPVVFSTTDNNYAMGIYSPDLPDPQWIGAGYGRFRFTSENCTKWNCVFRENSTPAGTYNYQCYVIVGSLANVTTSMTQLYNYLSPVSVGGTATASPLSVCNGAASTISVSDYAGNIQWQSSADGFSWTDIPGANAASYATSAMTTTTYYRAVVTNGSSAPANSTTTSVTVYAPLTAGEITGNVSPVCFNTPVTFQSNPSGGNGTNTINWFDNAGNPAGSGSTISWNAISSGCGYYTVSNSCGTATSSTACIVVNPASIGGTATANPSSVCSGTSSNITIAGYTGDIQWQSSPDGSTWSDISGANSSSYSTPALTNSVYYRAVVTNAGCSSENSSIATVTIHPPLTAGAITGYSSPVCYDTPITFQSNPSGGNGTNTINWFDNAGNPTGSGSTISWNAISSGCGYYTVLNSCGTATSSTACIVVNPASVGGTATANPSSVCSGTSSNITIAGYTGDIQWQSSPDGSTWSDISGANSSSYSTPALTNFAYYRAVVTNAGCSSENSNSAIVSVSSIPQTPVITQNGDTLFSSVVSGNQWYYNDTAILNATGNYIVPTNNGNYFVIASDSGCSSDTSSTVAFTLININNPTNNLQSYKIYPNPATTNVLIECDDEIYQQLLSVYNLYSQLLFSTTFYKKTQLNMASYPKGIYILYIRNSKNSYMQRIVKI
ncbi:MAG TPA: hypothetical protein DEH02_07400 [Bacteroidales bacterium]|nr:hypothetical protein [Bacteroidales bacterium]